MTNLDKTIEYLHYHGGANRRELMEALNLGIGDTQAKALLAEGISHGFIRTEGKARAIRYFITPKAHLLRTVDLDSYYAQDFDKRQVQTGFNFQLIRETLPAIDIFSKEEKARLEKCREMFAAHMVDLSQTGYNKEMERLGIDLSWKSSEIEGNTYTLLETVNLLKDKIEAKGKRREEAIMLLNHKEALKAIVERPYYFKALSLARIEDIHSILIEELGVERNLRHRRVGISGTLYRPLEVETQIREAIDDMCALVNGKSDPYEKALLALLLIAYIQPFMDGNKRTSRLVSNALLIAHGYCPLSFRSVEASDYRAALLLFYEQNNISAFKRIFIEQAEFAVKEYF